MNSKRRRSKKQKLIRSAIRASFCALALLITVVCINGLTHVVGKLLPSADSLPDLAEILAPEFGDQEKDSPSEPTADSNPLTVCIDAGHGGKDVGADNGVRFEKDDTLKLALATASYLKEQDINVILTRSDDTFLELSERCDVANGAGADYFVSIHRNKGDGAGVETWIYSNANEETTNLADNIMSSLADVGIQRNRGVKKGTQKSSSKNYYLNSHSDMPTCIVEMGFINDSTDNQLFDDNQTAYAKAIGDAVLATYDSYHTGSTASGSSKDAASGNTEEPASANSDNTASASNSDTASASNGNTASANSDNTASASNGDTASASTSHTLNNTPIDLASLDTTGQDWGPGSDVDGQNRPTSALSYQEKYGSYNASFIVPDSDKIYLTFDEGYENGCTPAILDTLKEKNVSAVFFVTAPFARENPDLIQRMIDEGHAVGNHSVTHPANGLPSQSIEEQQHEVTELHNYIKENYNYDMHLFRFPAGKFSTQSLAILNNCNYKSVFWSFAYLDYDTANQPDHTEALNKMTGKLHPGAIYLLHAVSTTNTEVLGSFIDQARAAGYEFALFD